MAVQLASSCIQPFKSHLFDNDYSFSRDDYDDHPFDSNYSLSRDDIDLIPKQSQSGRHLDKNYSFSRDDYDDHLFDNKYFLARDGDDSDLIPIRNYSFSSDNMDLILQQHLSLLTLKDRYKVPRSCLLTEKENSYVPPDFTRHRDGPILLQLLQLPSREEEHQLPGHLAYTDGQLELSELYFRCYFPAIQGPMLTCDEFPKSKRFVYEETTDQRYKVGNHFDYKSVLFTKERNFLIRNTGEEVHADQLQGKYIMVFALWIPVLAGDLVEQMCQAIINAYLELSRAGEESDFEVVLVARMRPDFDCPSFALSKAAFHHFFSAFPCLAIPWDDTCSRMMVSRSMPWFSCTYLTPCCILADKEGVILMNDPQPFKHYGAFLYPFTEEWRQKLYLKWGYRGVGLPLEDLLGLQVSSDALKCPCGHCSKQVSVSDLKQKLVLIYFCYDGRLIKEVHTQLTDFMSKVTDHNSQHYDFNVVITYQTSDPVNRLTWSPELLRGMLRSHNICGWLELPWTDKVSRALYTWVAEYTYTYDDCLIAVGPNTSYLDSFARKILCNHLGRYGLDLYPFTRVSLRHAIVAKLRALTFPDILTSRGISQLLRSGGAQVPVSSLIGSDVFLYFDRGYAPSFWLDRFIRWYNETRENKPTFEVIFVCLGENVTCFEDKIAKYPWLAVPYDKDVINGLFDDVYGFGSDWISYGMTAAFGSEGHIRSVKVQELLMDSESLSFPSESEVDLLEELKVMLAENVDYMILEEDE